MRYFDDFGRAERIRVLKEEQYQEGFLRELFVDCLNYTINPDKDFNLTTEFKNKTDAEKADGAILKNENPIAVIELKSTKTKDLKTIEKQAFNYKTHQSNCKYVITSNFDKIRLYINDATEFEEFNIFKLSENEFKFLYLCFSKESIFEDIPAIIKEKSNQHEEQISKKLYNDYSVFRNSIFQNLTKNNPQIDELLLFKKSQKLLDRFLFIFFAEDKGLIPPNLISKIIEDYNRLKEMDHYTPLYSEFKRFFGYINEGNEKYNIDAYNGGLFQFDEILDNVKIDDEILITDSLKLANFDFDSEVDVNILGHIFEHSLTDIEKLNAEISGENLDKKQTRRKKEGVFYTPNYITKYIVENTIGTLCNEKKNEFKLNNLEIDETYFKKTKKSLSKKGEQLFDKLEEYKEWLLSLKILDPACGSGAFLNQALNFLIDEHNFIIDLETDLRKGQYYAFDIDTAVLENNLYGVDINEESVEIAKLSLWLKTAKKGRKLTDLSNSIKCGNSLIDDPEIAGEKAFDWNIEFPEIMQNGGFDVVIGNPPYVNGITLQKIMPKQREWLKNHYNNLIEKWDLYLAFIEKALNLLQRNGYFSFIIPDAFLTEKYASKMRDEIRKHVKIIQIDSFPNLYIFENVGVYNIILVLQKDNPKLPIKKVKHIDLLGNRKEKFENNLTDIFSDFNFQKLNLKIENFLYLGNIFFISKGLVLNSDEKKYKGEFTKEDLLSEVQTEINNRKIVEGRNIEKYIINGHRFVEWDTERVPYKISRPTFQELYQANKILINKIGKLKIAFDYSGIVCDQSVRILIKWDQLKEIQNKSILNSISKFSDFSRDKLEDISIEYEYRFILTLLNSKCINFIFDNLRGKGSIDINPLLLRKIPIPKISKIHQIPFIEKADIMLSLNKQKQEKVNKFLHRFETNFEIEKFSNKMKAFNDYDFKTLISELNKKKIKLSLSQQDEWEEYFNNFKTEINEFQKQIDKTDIEIDQMVYELYGLTDEEIEIVENG